VCTYMYTPRTHIHTHPNTPAHQQEIQKKDHDWSLDQCSEEQNLYSTAGPQDTDCPIIVNWPRILLAFVELFQLKGLIPSPQGHLKFCVQAKKVGDPWHSESCTLKIHPHFPQNKQHSVVIRP
jgi:hypothetical protein